MSFSIVLQTNSSEKNRVDKSITDVRTLIGTLRADTSIVDPTFIIQCSLPDVINANYLTVREFGRSYFVTNVRSVRNGLVEFACHVDVLSSFKTQIRANSGIIHRSERNWNLYLNDGSLTAYQDPEIHTTEFTGGFPAARDFVLAVAGS